MLLAANKISEASFQMHALQLGKVRARIHYNLQYVCLHEIVIVIVIVIVIYIYIYIYIS